MRSLIETIAAELERPRELSNQVVKHLDGAYSIDREVIGPFLERELPTLEDYEHDLILSPLFTPKLNDQSIFAELLGATTVPRTDWPALIGELSNRPIRARLVTGDQQSHSVVLREVSIERYVHRLRLDGTIEDSILKCIDQTPNADHPMLKAVARRAVWEKTEQRDILRRYLTGSLSAGTYSPSDSVNLLKLVEDYQPANSPALLSRIPRWQQTLRDEIQTAYDPKPFFSGSIQALHGGSDQRHGDDDKATTKRNELAFLERLVAVLAEE
ncbi:MAG TPA: hypothetical protein VK210_16515 [Terriglobia bacterium]|nr:hypothetical protein [Terriglobia bacterium]